MQPLPLHRCTTTLQAPHPPPVTCTSPTPPAPVLHSSPFPFPASGPTCPADEHLAAHLDSAPLTGMDGHTEGLQQCSFIKAHMVREPAHGEGRGGRLQTCIGGWRTQTQAHTHTHTHTHRHTRMHTRMHAHARTCTHACTHMHTRMHAHAHTHALTHTHTHTHLWQKSAA